MQECPSVTTTADERVAAIGGALTYAGLAVLLSLLAWRRAAVVSRVVFGLCVLTSLYTVFVEGGQRLQAVMGR